MRYQYYHKLVYIVGSIRSPGSAGPTHTLNSDNTRGASRKQSGMKLTPAAMRVREGTKKGKVRKGTARAGNASATPVRKSTEAAKLKKVKPVETSAARKKKGVVKKKSVKTVKKKDKFEGLPEELMWIKEDPQELLLSRFVETPKGTRLGESIGVDKTQLILKNKSKFYSIPLKFIKEKKNKLVLRKKVNWKTAARKGEHWRKITLDPMYQKTKKKMKKKKL